MKALLPILKQKRGLCVCAAVLLAAQALFGLLAPTLLGEAIDTGVQKKGYTDDAPKVLGESAFSLFAELLPESERQTLLETYVLSKEPPAGTPEEYAAYGLRRYLRPEADANAVRELYENAVWCAVLAARDREGFDAPDYDALIERISLRKLTRLATGVSFTETQRETYYTAARGTKRALKVHAASILLPYLYEDAGLNVNARQKAFSRKIAAALIAAAVLQFAAAAGAAVCLASLSAAVEAALRNALLRQALRFSRQERAAFPAGRLHYLGASGASQVGMMLPHAFRSLFFAPTLAIAGSLLTFRKSLSFGLLTLGGAALILAAAGLLYLINYRRYYRMQANAETAVRRTDAAVRQLFTVRAANGQSFEQRKYEAVSAAVCKDEKGVMGSVLMGLQLAGLFTNALTALILASGLNGILESSMHVGDLIAYLQYALLTASAFLMLGVTAIFAPKALLSLKAIDRVLLKTPAERAFEPNTAAVPRVDRVRFENVRLSENAPPVSFTAKRGALTLITGAAGTGKTLLAQSLLREFAPASGRIYLNATEITALSPAYPADTVFYAPGRPALFTATLRRNLELHGAAGTDDELLWALKQAECGFLAQTAADLDRVLQNAGESLSGGQRSRLALAACFAKKAQIYIFDDCFSAVNLDIRKRLLERIAALKKNAVVLLITQDPGLAPPADRTVYLSETGATVQEGGGRNGQ